MPNFFLQVMLEEANWNDDIKNCEDHCQKIASFAYNKALNFVDDDFFISKDVVVSLLLTNDSEIRQINKDFRGIDKPTNVLSFAAFDSLSKDIENIEMQNYDEIMLGDIAIAYETTKKEAKTQKKQLKDHLSHLIVHGVLHLLGFDHIKDDEADVMENLEIKILDDFGVSNPYTILD